MQTEVKRLEHQVKEARELVRGHTFEESPTAFKNLESLKVRLTVAKNPNHYCRQVSAVVRCAVCAEGCLMNRDTLLYISLASALVGISLIEHGIFGFTDFFLGVYWLIVGTRSLFKDFEKLSTP